jgi:hypothetical protein
LEISEALQPISISQEATFIPDFSAGQAFLSIINMKKIDQ